MGAFALALGLVAMGCDDGEDASPPTTVSIPPAPTGTTVPRRPDDGRLTVGLLLPRSGAARTVGDELWDTATDTIRDINDAGGVRGQQIVTVTADEGESATDAADAVAELLEQNVDAVVGPASSTSALATLDLLLDAGVLTCSPTATALALDDFPNSNLFVRTAPSDSLQAAALARLALNTGQRSVAILWVDDVYGRPFASAVADSVGEGMEVVSGQAFDGTSDLEDVATGTLAENPGVVVIIADGDLGTRMIAALADAVDAEPDAVAPEILVNDAVRVLSPSYRARIAELSDDFRRRIRGVSPFVTGSESEPSAIGTNAFDCVTLIALAAHLGGPDDALAMRGELSDLTVTGGPCRDFETCVGNLERSLNIDYEGPAGPVEIGSDGDPVRARFEIFTFESDGIAQREGQLTGP